VSLQLGVPLFIVAVLLQATVLPHLRVYGGQPDLVVLLVLAWSTLDQEQEGLAWAFVGGLLLDLFSGTPIGVSSLALLPLAYLIGLLEAQVYRASLLLPLLLTAVGSTAYHVIYMLLLRFLTDYPLSWSASFGYVTLPSVLFDVVLFIPVLRLLARWHDRLHPRQVKI
jgi:rod shape-determining protein MreD